MPRQTADLIALLLAATVSLIILSTAFVLLYLEVVNPDQDTAQAGETISRIVSVIIAALVGYMAGRARRNGNGNGH
jgi:uncharacterized membrane protein